MRGNADRSGPTHRSPIRPEAEASPGSPVMTTLVGGCRRGGRAAARPMICAQRLHPEPRGRHATRQPYERLVWGITMKFFAATTVFIMASSVLIGATDNGGSSDTLRIIRGLMAECALPFTDRNSYRGRTLDQFDNPDCIKKVAQKIIDLANLGDLDIKMAEYTAKLSDARFLFRHRRVDSQPQFCATIERFPRNKDGWNQSTSCGGDYKSGFLKLPRVCSYLNSSCLKGPEREFSNVTLHYNLIDDIGIDVSLTVRFDGRSIIDSAQLAYTREDGLYVSLMINENMPG